MQTKYLNKLERVLYFVSTFRNRNIEFKFVDGAEVYQTSNHTSIQIPPHSNKETLLRFSQSHQYDGVKFTHQASVVKVFHKDKNPKHEPYRKTFYDRLDDSAFLYINPKSTELEYKSDTRDEALLEIPDYDINTEGGEFQYSLLHNDEQLGIMQIIQYFHNANTDYTIGSWMHSEIDLIYEELNEQYNIGREDYLLGDGIS